MKILITSIVDIEQTAHGRLYRLLRYLAPKHEITVISIRDWWKAGQKSVGEGNRELDEILKKVEIKHLTEKKASPVIQELYSFKTASSILKDINYKSFDAHLNYNSLVSGYVVTKKLKGAGIKTVYDVADDLPEMIKTSPQIPSFMRPVGGFIGQAVLDENIKNSEVVTVAGRYLKEELKSPKVKVIPNGVDTDIFRYAPQNDLRQDLSLDEAFVVGYMGALREWIDLEPVFKAVKDAKEKIDLKFLIVGGEEGYKKNKELAAKYGVEKETLFIGAVPYTKVPEYISAMDACLIPFRKNKVSDNSCPLKLFEYMSCEKPVISTRINEVEHIVGDRILYASTPEEYKGQILRLNNDDKMRNVLGSEGRVFVKENYEWAGITKDFETALDSVKKKAA